MNARDRKASRAWPRFLTLILGTLALPVCAAGSKTPTLPAGSGGSASLPSAVGAPHTPTVDQKPLPLHASGPSGSRGAGPKTIVRQPDEPPEHFATRVLPTGAETITKPLEFELPPLGKVVLVLYDVASDDPAGMNDPSVYRGMVLVPNRTTGTYRIEMLPSQAAGAGILMYEVKSVFTADADGDGAPDICILSEITEAGTGDSKAPHTDTDLFKWSGSGFADVHQGDNRPLYNLRNAKAVRARLKKMHD